MASNLLDVGAGGETAQTLYFVSFAPSILTSDIVEQSGDDWAKRFRVTTDDSQSPQLTTIYDLRRGEEQVLARIEWQGHPVVEIRDILGRQSARSWLGLVPDRSARNMEASGIKYIWAPYLDDICLYLPDENFTRIVARATKKADMAVLQLSRDAIELKLQEIAILAVILLLSGRNID